MSWNPGSEEIYVLFAPGRMPSKNPSMTANAMSQTGLATIQRELQVLQLIFDIFQALNKSLNLDEALPPILKMVMEHMGMMHCSVFIMDRETGETEIDISHGLSDEWGENTQFRMGAGIVERAMETGVPVIEEKMSPDCRFLNGKHAGRQDEGCESNERCLLCVPIRCANEIIGAISAGGRSVKGLSHEEDMRLLEIFGDLVAQAVGIRREAREQTRMLREEKARLQSEMLMHCKPANMVGSSHGMVQVFHLIRQVASSDARVLISGESGVGKGLVAETIHRNSLRADKPLARANLMAFPENMIESELFGYERGAIAGASGMRKGLLEIADGGTLLLDEIGVLPIKTQAKLLRVIQEGEFERLGGTKTIKADVRIISATNRNLEELVRNYKFRVDLFYRLNLFPIFVPPLRERKTDIPLLIDHFIERLCKESGKRIGRVSAAAIDMMMNYHWPGNVQELQDCVERSAMMSTDGIIHGHHLPFAIQTAETSSTPSQGKLLASMAVFEREMIADALKSSHGNAARAARLLEVSERFMRLRMMKHGIDAKQFKCMPARTV